MSKGYAENPGCARFSYKKYYSVRALLFSKFGSPKKLVLKLHSDTRIPYVTRVLRGGDTQPALVCSADPFLVSAYSDEMDAVVMLEFPKELRVRYGLSVGSRLVTSNFYAPGSGSNISDDIFIGEGYLKRYRNFIPIVQLFLASDDEWIRSRIFLFDKERWDRVEALTKDHLEKHPGITRQGFYYFM